MKKTLIALAALAATGAVMAQSSVTIYGVVDQAFTRTSNSDGGTSNTGLTSSGNVTNRLGFRGTEDLGGGLKAKFQIETNLAADAPAASTIGDRGAWVAIASDKMGEVRLGRDYNNAFWNPILFSAWGTNGVGQNIAHATRGAFIGGTASAPIHSNYIWNNNSISYILPSNLGGVYGNIQYAFDEVATAGNSKGKSLNLRLGYANGPLNVAVGYGDTDGGAFTQLAATSATDPTPVNFSGTATDIKSTNLGASYDFGVVRVMGSWFQDTAKVTATGATAAKLKGWELGAVMPMGSGRLRASYGRADLDHDNSAATLDRKASKIAVGYVYDLSKRTSVYTSYARVSNKNGSNVRLAPAGSAPNPLVNFTSSGIDFGISHTF